MNVGKLILSIAWVIQIAEIGFAIFATVGYLYLTYRCLVKIIKGERKDKLLGLTGLSLLLMFGLLLIFLFFTFSQG